MALAIFDLDNTLIAGDSDYSWGQFLVDKQLVDADAYRLANDQFYQDYKNATLDIRRYLQFSLKPLTEHSMERLVQLHQEFMTDYIAPMMLSKAQELLAHHRAQGDFLLIITATNGFVTRPIARALGVDDIITTDPEVRDGRYTGDFIGTPTFQQGKVTRLQEWLAKHHFDLSDAWFYSDSINDLPLLERVGKPVVVDGDERLSSLAELRNWPHISLRS